MKATVIGSYGSPLDSFDNPWHVDEDTERLDEQGYVPQAPTHLPRYPQSREIDLSSLIVAAPSMALVVLAGVLAWYNGTAGNVGAALECPDFSDNFAPQTATSTP